MLGRDQHDFSQKKEQADEAAGGACEDTFNQRTFGEPSQPQMRTLEETEYFGRGLDGTDSKHA